MYISANSNPNLNPNFKPNSYPNPNFNSKVQKRFWKNEMTSFFEQVSVQITHLTFKLN